MRTVAMRTWALLLVIFSLLLVSACEPVMVAPTPGPVHFISAYPPHAPANGYRYHYGDHDLVYDSDLDAYIVLGFDGIYFYNDLYLRFFNGNWQVVAHLNEPWRIAQYQQVPGKLRSHRNIDRHSRHDGPPPNAPAHGYRQRYRDSDLEYRSDLGAYVVLGFDGMYFFNDLYLRFFDGYWHVADRRDGYWRRAEHQQIPSKLWRNRQYSRQLREEPPPHAPAHGYRHHYRDVDMVFDNSIGAYVVLGFDDLFFLDGLYMRFYDGRWHTADRYNGKWYIADDRRIPNKLRHANSQEKQGLYKRMKQQYKKEHQEERKSFDRNRQDRNRNENRVNRIGGYENRTKNKAVDINNKKDTNQPDSKNDSGGLFDKLKKQHEEEQTQ